MTEQREAGTARSPAELRQLLPKLEQAAVEQQYAQLRAMGSASAACALIGLLLAVLAFIGRVTGLFVLSSLVPGGKSMLPAAAFSFAVLSLAVLALSLSRRPPYRFVRACGLAVVLLGVARVLEYGLSVEWHVNELFLTHILPPGPPDTRYAAVGAAAIAVIGLGAMFFTWPATRRIANGLGVSGAVVGTLFCLTYILGGPMLHETPLVSVALPSALALMAVGTGLAICVSRWDRAVEELTDARIVANQAELARLTEELERQRNELEAIVASAPSAIMSFDRDGRMLRINPGGRQMVGKIRFSDAPTAVPAELQADVVDEQGNPVALEDLAVSRALRGEPVHGIITNLRNAAAGPIWVSASAVPTYNAQGEVDGAVLVMTDVTALREAREEAQRYAAEVQSIMDHAPVGIILYDPQGNIRRLNETARQALRMTEEMMRKPVTERFQLHDIVDEEGNQIMPDRGVVAAVMAGHTVRNVVANFRNTPAGSVWVSMSGAPIRAEDGTIRGIIAVFADVTMLHDTREQAQQLANELETVLSSIADGVAVYDLQGRGLRANPAAERILQYTQEIMGLTWQERIKIAAPIGEDGQPLEPENFPLKRALDGERVLDFTMRFELRFKEPSELTPWLSLSAAPVRRDGQNTGAVLVFSDISERRQIEQELLSYRDHLEGLVARRTARLEEHQRRLRALAAELQVAEQRERQRLASVLHDGVAQTLGAIKLHLSVLRAGMPTPPTADQIARLIEMVEEAVLQSRTIMMDLVPPTLQQQGLVEALRWWGQQVKEKHGLEVLVEAEETVKRLAPDVEATVFQIAKELLQNTVKYAQATQVNINVTFGVSKLKIEIADNGVGFDPATLEVTEQGGFGLFSARERMAYLGGDFELESAPGKGTRARLTLPLRSEGAAPQSVSAPATQSP